VNLFQALLLGILQGASEFLPISSSGHLVLVPWLLNWPAPGLTFDAVVHWGTAAAVVVYFWRDWVTLAGAAIRILGETGFFRKNPVSGGAEPSQGSTDARLVWLILLGTIPAAVIGYLFDDFFEAMFARPVAAAGFLLVTAALLTASERIGRREHGVESLTWLDALLVGLAQALAIFPGVSRSGATIAAGLTRNLKRESAARFSFLLATPIILAAGLFKLVDLVEAGGLATQGSALILGFVAAGVVGYGCIHFLMRYLEQRRLYPFAVYCAVAGILCLLVAWARGG
jgi:undecaprenyl-diphosphatase